MDFSRFPALPSKWIARSSAMVYWAIAEAFLRADWLHHPVSLDVAIQSVLVHVGWECDD